MTRLLDRIAWEIYCRAPVQWEQVGRRGLRAWIARTSGNRVRDAISDRRFKSWR